jgi:hypothetical protein
MIRRRLGVPLFKICSASREPAESFVAQASFAKFDARGRQNESPPNQAAGKNKGSTAARQGNTALAASFRNVFVNQCPLRLRNS